MESVATEQNVTEARFVAARSPRPDLQLDLACTILRIEQAHAASNEVLAAHLLERLATCDAPRLRGHLDNRGRGYLRMALED